MTHPQETAQDTAQDAPTTTLNIIKEDTASEGGCCGGSCGCGHS